MGIGRYLRSRWNDVHVHPLEPANSPTLKTGTCVGVHRIQGISDEFIPKIVDLQEIDDLVDVWDGDAILMAQKLMSEPWPGGRNFIGREFVGRGQAPTGLGARRGCRNFCFPTLTRNTFRRTSANAKPKNLNTFQHRSRWPVFQQSVSRRKKFDTYPVGNALAQPKFPKSGSKTFFGKKFWREN